MVAQKKRVPLQPSVAQKKRVPVWQSVVYERANADYAALRKLLPPKIRFSMSSDPDNGKVSLSPLGDGRMFTDRELAVLDRYFAMLGFKERRVHIIRSVRSLNPERFVTYPSE
jgi:hypothetical protein